MTRAGYQDLSLLQWMLLVTKLSDSADRDKTKAGTQSLSSTLLNIGNIGSDPSMYNN